MTFRVKATLSEDAREFDGSIQLRYASPKNSWAFTGPLKEKCPPVDKLTKGTRVIVTYEGSPVKHTMGAKVLKIELDGA